MMPEEKQIDQKIKETNFQRTVALIKDFQLRLLENNSHFKADMSKPAIPYKKKICETFAEKLILIKKEAESNQFKTCEAIS